MNTFRCLIISLFIPFIVLAQEDLPVTQDVQIEVLTTELEKSTKPQTVQIVLTVGSGNTSSMNLYFESVISSITPVAVSRGTENLWLINADEANTNSKVLAWQYLATEKQTQVLPGDWSLPYTLTFELQISFERMRELKELDELIFTLSTEIGGKIFIASASGRGTIISLK
jgi:hypothetical protein